MLSFAFFYFFASESRYPIRTVIIKGVYWHIDPRDIEKIAAPCAKRGYFLANLFSLQRQLMKNLAWAEDVSVSRQWPDTIVLTINQKEAVATLNHSVLVTGNGEVFSPPINTFPPDLFVLIGPTESAAELLTQYRLLSSVATNSVDLLINQVKLSPEGDWSVELSNKIVVMLGNKDILMRFQRFMKIYQQVFIPQHREPSYVDMRYSHGMAVNWKS